MLIDTDELLTELYEKFPDKVPDKVKDMRELGIKVGEQRPMKFIEHIIERKEHEAHRKLQEKAKYS